MVPQLDIRELRTALNRAGTSCLNEAGNYLSRNELQNKLQLCAEKYVRDNTHIFEGHCIHLCRLDQRRYEDSYYKLKCDKGKTRNLKCKRPKCNKDQCIKDLQYKFIMKTAGAKR